MQRKVTLPSGQEVIYDDVPITVTEEGLRKYAAEDPKVAPHLQGVDVEAWIKHGKVGLAEDLARSAVGGAVRGVAGGMDFWRQGASGLALMGMDAAGMKGGVDKFARWSGELQEDIDKTVGKLGGGYKPQTLAGDYTGAVTQGAGGAAAGGAKSLWALALGGAAGGGAKAAEHAGLGIPGIIAASFGIPLGAALTRRTLFPKLGYDEVQSAAGIPKRSWWQVGRSPEQRAANAQLEASRGVMRDADQQGVTLLPAQAMQNPNAPQSGLINLQNRITPTTAGASTLKPVLDAQVGQAGTVVNNILALARESGQYANDLQASRALYQMLRNQPLDPAMRQQVASELRASNFFQTRGSPQRRILEQALGMLENQGTQMIPGSTVATQTPVQSGRQTVPLIGTQQVPPQTTPLPAQTQGQLLDIRDTASAAYRAAPDIEPNVRNAAIAETRTILNRGRSPQVAAVDDTFGAAMNKQNFVRRLEQEAAAARNADPEMVGANFANRARGAPGSTTRQAWQDAIDPVQFEDPETAERISRAWTLLERTGFGRGGTRRIEPGEYGQARGSAASAATSAAGLSPRALPLAFTAGLRQKLMEAEAEKIAAALADRSGRKLSELLNYSPNKELARNILLTMGIGYGIETAPTGEE